MTLPELAISIQSRPFGHTSTFVELENGRILHASYRALEWSDDVGMTWSRAQHEDELMVDINGDPVGGAETSIVKLSGKNAVGLCARIPGAMAEGTWAMPTRNLGFKFWRSNDGGKTWQPPVIMTPPGMVTAGLQDTFLRTSSGRIVLPVFVILGDKSKKRMGPRDEHQPMSGHLVKNQWMSSAGHFFDPSYSCNYVLYSDNDGDNWQMNKDGPMMIMGDWNSDYQYSNEASVTEVKPGRLLLMARNGMGRLFQAWSNDNGETWTRLQPTSLAACTTPAQIRTLPNGHLLCVWNQTSEQETKSGLNRTRISSAISRDGGRVWEFFQNVQSLHETTRVEPGPIHPVRPEEISFPAGRAATERDPQYIGNREEHARFSYPSVFVMKDRVFITHTYKGMLMEHPTLAQLIEHRTGDIHPETGEIMGQYLKILPLKWFYGGKEPADNPFLKEAYEPAKP